MDILVSGLMAYDWTMDFPGRFSDQPLATQKPRDAASPNPRGLNCKYVAKQSLARVARLQTECTKKGVHFTSSSKDLRKTRTMPQRGFARASKGKHHLISLSVRYGHIGNIAS